MKELWSNNPEKILEEINLLIKKNTSLSLVQKGHKPAIITAEEVTEKNILLAKRQAFQVINDTHLVLYQLEEQLMHGFMITPISQTETHIKTRIPDEIVQFQRRKFPRLTTSEKSTATFTRQGSQLLYNSIIKDICLEGAKIEGAFADKIKKGDILSPLTLTLRLSHGDFEEKIIIPQAEVKWIFETEEDNKSIGVHFNLAEDEKTEIELFISLLSAEKGTSKK